MHVASSSVKQLRTCGRWPWKSAAILPLARVDNTCHIVRPFGRLEPGVSEGGGEREEGEREREGVSEGGGEREEREEGERGCE